MVSLKTYIDFLRIKDWFYLIGIALLGFLYGIKVLNLFDIFILFLISSLYLAHGYTLNNCFGIRNLSKGLHFKTGLFISFFLFAMNCLISFLFSKTIFLLVIAGGFIGLLYSAKPFRLKENLVSNFILNSLGFSILFLIGFGLNKSLSVESWLLFLYIALFMVPHQVVHILSHRNEYKLRNYNLIKLFYPSLLILTFWSLIIFYIFSITPFLFILTVAFSAIQAYIFKSKLHEKNFKKIRILMRVVSMAFGVLMMLILIFA